MTKMKARNFMVSLLTIVSVLFLVATVSATEIANIYKIEVDNQNILDGTPSLIAGETVTVRVYFEALQNAEDVRIKAEIEGDKEDITDRTSLFDIEENKTYSKKLTLTIPFDLDDVLSDDLYLYLKIWNSDFETEEESILLRIQRPSYNADVKSISVSQSVEAGETFPIEIVLENMGYKDLNDIYVTAKISALGVSKTSYFGDIVAVECDEDDDSIENYGVDITRKCNEDDQNTIRGQLSLKVPYGAEAGLYTLEIEVTNDDTTTSVVKQIAVENEFSNNVIVTSYSKTVASGENAEYELLIVNPTDKVKVYRLVTENSGELSTNVNEVIAVPAGSSKSVSIGATADSEGEYNFNVNVFSGEELVDTVTLNLKVEGKSMADLTVVLTVILAIIFIVLLVVLIVLIGKKPAKSEEFGESYY